ncbi:MAG: hypothetical protein AAFY65_07340 [Pseudomonadota bacterium]
MIRRMPAIAATVLALGAAPAVASPCGPVDGPATDNISAFEQAFLDQDWGAVGATMPMFDPAMVDGMVEQFRTIGVPFTSCETVYAGHLAPHIYSRATIYYVETGVGLMTYLDIATMQGETNIVNVQATATFTELMDLIK